MLSCEASRECGRLSKVHTTVCMRFTNQQSPVQQMDSVLIRSVCSLLGGRHLAILTFNNIQWIPWILFEESRQTSIARTHGSKKPILRVVIPIMQPLLPSVSLWASCTTSQEQCKFVWLCSTDVLKHTTVSSFPSQHLDPPLLWNILLSQSQVVISSVEWLPSVKKASLT